MYRNPVPGKLKLVEQYLDYKHTSARFYDLGEKEVCTLFFYAEVKS